MGVKERWKRFRPLPEDITQKLSTLDPIFKRHSVRLTYLFGSLAQGETGEDVDLALWVDERGWEGLRREITQTLDTERMDLLNLATASPVMRFEVVRNGVLIYKQSEDLENTFELRTIQEYRDTAYLRRKQREVLRERTKQWLSGER